MPKGPQGQKRPADTVQSAIMGARIAVGEVQEIAAPNVKTVRAAAGKKGGAARAVKLESGRRTEIAKKAAKTRWAKD